MKHLEWIEKQKEKLRQTELEAKLSKIAAEKAKKAAMLVRRNE